MTIPTLGLIGLTLVIQAPSALSPSSQKRSLGAQRGVAQVPTGQITGTVTDRSGAVVPNAQVTLELPNGQRRITTTSSEGRYRFHGVPFGTGYRLLFVAQGFQTLVMPNLTIQSGSSATFDAQFTFGPPTPTPTPFPTPSPSPAPSPEVSPSPIDPNDWSAVAKRELAKLQESKILFNTPTEMRQGQKETVEVRISPEDIGAALANNLEGRGQPTIEPIKISPLMKVSMTGDEGAFSIRKLNQDETQVLSEPYTEWKWEVVPLESGTHFLNIQVTAVVRIPERGDTFKDIPVASKPIKVKVDPWFVSKRFVGNNWQWLWAVIVAPVGGLLWGLMRKRRKGQRAGFR